MSENNTIFEKLSRNGRYRQIFTQKAFLGKGSFGRVYLVLHSIEKRYYAIKKIDFKAPDFEKTPEKFKDECLKEIRFMKTLKKDYVIDYKTAWSEYDDLFYIQMELCEYDLNNLLQKLREEFKQNPSETSSSIKYYISSELFNEILEALNYLHSQNPPIIHRDLKPDNILITNGVKGRFVKLADFGLAVIHKFKEETHTQDKGTIEYMAPEVGNGRHYDTRADVYSLGLIARQLFNLSSNISIDDLLLTEKFESAQNLITKMTSVEEKTRPYCQQILDTEKLWYFNIEILIEDSNYKNIIESKLNQSMIDCFHKYFIRTKHSRSTGEAINDLLDDEMVDISLKSGQKEAAEMLEEYSTSPTFILMVDFLLKSNKSGMEQLEPRKYFVENLYAFCEQVELNEAFMKEFVKHYNREYIDEVLKYDNEMAQKTFIFLEFTRERSTCNEMVYILLKSHQRDAAEILESYNTSPPFIPISFEIELPITPATVLRSGYSKWYTMDKNPRGMCIIINNMKDVLQKESLRFQNIFRQLSFVVELWYDLSATDMEKRLIELSKRKSLSEDNALIVMTISHGNDEKIYGSDGSNLRTSTIVDLFSTDNCKALSMKPKLFFFNTCRIKDGNVAVTATEYPKQPKIIELENVGQVWINKDKSTFICSTYTNDYNFWFIPNQLTFFGQALSHCIAQYSCDESVDSILKYTSERMSKIRSTEIRVFRMSRRLYFNPGFIFNY